MPEATVAFFKGDFVPMADACVSIRTKALNYGLGCFEGIRGYWDNTGSQLYIFRVKDHYKRLEDSCRILQMRLRYTVDEMVKITAELCRRNGHKEDVYVRPIAYNGSELLPPIMSMDDDELAIYTLPLRDYLDTAKGVTACVSSWLRVSDNMIPARAKPTAAYLNSALARGEAKANGFDEAIFLTRDGFVAEASAEHVFLVRDGKLITPTVQSDNLEGITRRTIIELARAEFGREVIERNVIRTDLYVADEAFLCGTGAEITPLVEIDRRPVAGGKMGPVTKELQDLFFKVVRSEVPKYSHWCLPVYE